MVVVVFFNAPNLNLAKEPYIEDSVIKLLILASGLEDA